MLSKYFIRNFSAVGLLVLAFACSASQEKPPVMDDPIVPLLSGAENRIEALCKQGNLPGFSKDEHGVITSPVLAGGTKIVYPLVFTFQVEKDPSDHKIYWFMLQKLSADSEWKIIKAWKTDLQGKNREELK